MSDKFLVTFAHFFAFLETEAIAIFPAAASSCVTEITTASGDLPLL